MNIKNFSVSLLALTTACLPAASHGAFTSQEIFDTLHFAARLNPFEQQDQFLYGVRNESTSRSYFDQIGLSLNVVGYGSVVAQTGNTDTKMSRFDNDGKAYYMFIDAEMHPMLNWDLLLGMRLWSANVNRNGIEYHTYGYPIVLAFKYNDDTFRIGLEFGLELFSSFSLSKDTKAKIENSGSPELKQLMEALGLVKIKNGQARFHIGVVKDLSSTWWAGARTSIGTLQPLPHSDLPDDPTKLGIFRRNLAFGLRRTIDANFVLEAGKSLGAKFPFIDWTLHKYVGANMEFSQLAEVNYSDRDIQFGAIFGLKLRAAMPYLTVKWAISAKMMQHYSTVNFSFQFNITQW